MCSLSHFHLFSFFCIFIFVAIKWFDADPTNESCESSDTEDPNVDFEPLINQAGEVDDEDKDKWIMWFDGAWNALGHGIGAVLVSLNKQYIPFTARLCFDYTNNIAEYEAYALGIRAAIDFRVKLLKVYGDSALVIHRLKGECETRDHKLVPY